MPPYVPSSQYSHSGDAPAESCNPFLTNPHLAAVQVELDVRDRVIKKLEDALAKTKEELMGYTELFSGIKRDTYHAQLSIDRAEYYGSRSRLDISFEVEEGAVAVKWLDAIKEAGK